MRVDPNAARPLFDQLRTQIIGGIRDGQLEPGTRLPTVRELAGQINLAVNTVARAYRELEQSGLVETRGRRGTFVAVRTKHAEQARQAASGYAERCRELGLPPDEALRLAADALGTSVPVAAD